MEASYSLDTGLSPDLSGRGDPPTPACFLTDKGYRSSIVYSRKNVTGKLVVYKRLMGSLRLRDGVEEHLLDLIDLPA